MHGGAITLIFPHQLFKEHPATEQGRPIYLVEEFLFFRQFKYHKQKLALHRASMRHYKGNLESKGLSVEYIDATNERSDIRQLIPHLASRGVKKIYTTHADDDWLGRRIAHACKIHSIELVLFDSPNFFNTQTEIENYQSGKTYFQTAFYIAERKKRNILIHDGSPVGGKWTYDEENRRKLPTHVNLPYPMTLGDDELVEEAWQYVNENFSNNPGELETRNGKPVRHYPINVEEAELWLQDFLQYRFAAFGPYQDAIRIGEHWIFHSLLSALLNTGLLSPQHVTEQAVLAAKKYTIPLNSLEGFLRQVLGWREFVRMVYIREGRKERTKNYWLFSRQLPASFWNGKTGIEPIDIIIKKILRTGYAHHIERLMVLGNFMLLCEFDPDSVYRWFMEMFIDAYDWVMVPNVYGMSQFADGGLMSTKPYIAGSNYILKMSDCKKGPWCATWDALFWRFVHVHRTLFAKNPRTNMLVKNFDRLLPETRKQHLDTAEKFLHSLDTAAAYI